MVGQGEGGPFTLDTGAGHGVGQVWLVCCEAGQEKGGVGKNRTGHGMGL